MGARVEFEGGEGDAVTNFLDGRGDDGSGIERVTEFEVHAAADVLQLEHGTSPGGTGDGDLDGLGTEFGMTGEQSFTAAEKYGGVTVVQGLNFEHCRGRKVVQENAAFNFRLDDAAVDFVGQVGVRVKHRYQTCWRLGIRVSGFGGADKRTLGPGWKRRSMTFRGGWGRMGCREFWGPSFGSACPGQRPGPRPGPT